MSDELELMDRRLVERNIRKGVLTRSDFEGYLKALPDVEDNAEELVIEDDFLQNTTRDEIRIKASTEDEDLSVD